MGFLIQSVPAIKGLIVLDLSKPEQPTEISRLKIIGRMAGRKRVRRMVPFFPNPEVVRLPRAGRRKNRGKFFGSA